MKTPHTDALWKRGIPLCEAPYRFAPARLAAPQPVPRDPNGTELPGGLKMLADQKGWDQGRRKAINDGLVQIQAAFGDLRAVAAFNSKRQRHVVDLVLRSKAVAMGFRNGAKEPEIIPAYLFETESFVKWNLNQIAGNGFDFISVKITKLRPSEKLPDEPRKSNAQTKSKPGRPGFGEIVGLIRGKKSDPQFRKLPRKAQAQLIEKLAREKIRHYFAHGKGISQPTLYRYLKQELGD